MTRRPFAYITDRGRVVRKDVLEEFAVGGGRDVATKAESQQLDERDKDDPALKTGRAGLVAPQYNPDQLASLLEMNTYHLRACRTKSRESGGLGFRLVPADETTSADDMGRDQLAVRDRLREWFDNLDQPITKTAENMVMDFESFGYAGLEYIAEPGGEPEDLRHIPIQHVRRHKDRTRYLQEREDDHAWFQDITADEDIDVKTGDPYDESLEPGEDELSADGDLRGRPVQSRRANRLIWFQNYTSKSDYYGLPDVSPAIGAIMGDLSRRDYNIAFFDNHGIPAYAVFVTGNFEPGEPKDSEGNIDPNGRTDLEAAVEDHFGQLADKPHSTLFLSIPSTEESEGEVDVRIEKLATEVTDASFRLYRMDNRDEVLSAHGVPAERAGIHVEGALGGNVAKEASEIYKRSILDQRQEMIEESINKRVLRDGFGIRDWKFKFEEIDLRDTQAEFDRDITMLTNGILSPNEFRARWKLDKVNDPAMDLHYMSQMVPIDADEDEIPDALRKQQPPAQTGASTDGTGQNGVMVRVGRNGKDPADPATNGNRQPANPARS